MKGVSLEVEEGELAFILGPNGSGKSTLMKCVAGILRGSGRIRIDGRDIADMSRREISRIVGYVPQLTGYAARTHLLVYEAVLLGRRPYFEWGPGRRDYEAAEEAMRIMRVSHLKTRRLRALSGGELQRVMIARALAQEPRLLLLDEPTSNLDIRSQIELIGVLREALEKGVTVLVSTHDINLAALYADRVVMMRGGKILASGPPGEVVSRDNIKTVYGVDVELVNYNGRKLVVPLSTGE